ncbi:MAG TPA: hypothetical protein VGG14_01755 [Candidatus Sulfotelmatobacter sp.]|jgi:hypothetical protein
MEEHKGLLSSAWGRVAHNKRYIIWFYILNLVLAWLGAAAFSNQAHEYLDHSLLSQRLVQGMDIGVVIEMFIQPDFGTVHAATAAGLHFALAFFLLTALFMPGVLQGYSSTYRLPREDFFRACGRNLWRFIRLMIIAGIVIGAVAAGLFALRVAIVKAAEKSTNELLPFEMRMLGLAIIFLVMTALRIWFDLAEADVVLSEQNAVRRSIGRGFRHTWRNLGQLVGSYVLITIVALIILGAGLVTWEKLIPATSVAGAFVLTQFMLLLLLIPRFWQRGVAVSYYLENMVAPIVVNTLTPPVAVAAPSPLRPIPPAEPQAT